MKRETLKMFFDAVLEDSFLAELNRDASFQVLLWTAFKRNADVLSDAIEQEIENAKNS